jgi:iron(III) transport system permease protein
MSNAVVANIPQKAKRFFKREWIRLLFLITICLFGVLPIGTILFKISGSDWSFIFSDRNFYSSLLNSLLYSSIGALLSTVFGLLFAYFLNRSSLKNKALFLVLLTFPMLVPTLSVGLGIRTLFGSNGFLDKLFGINIDAIGMPALIIGSFITTFPIAFLVLYDALAYENRSPYDAARTLGISGWSSFWHITIPYLKVPLISAYFAALTLVFSDYGVPMEVAGMVKTLPMYLYEQVMSTYQYGRASIVSLFLLLPALVSFIMDLIVHDAPSGDNTRSLFEPKKSFDIISLAAIIPFTVLLVLPQIAFIILAFVSSFPNDLSFTFAHFSAAFSNGYGVGVQQYLQNSLLMSFLTGLVGTAIAFVMAYVSTRIEGKLGKVIHIFALASLAIPGLVLGIGYIFFFKDSRGWFYGTMAILVTANVVHFLGSPYVMARNSLSKQNKDYEIVGNSLGINRFHVFWRVIVPNSFSTLVEMFSYFFLSSMTTISAVAFLCTYKNQPLSILITTFDKTSNYEMQAVVSFLILVVNVLIKSLFGVCNKIITAHLSRERKQFMPLTRYQFDLLTFLESNGKKKYSQRYLSDVLTLSLGTTNKTLNDLLGLGYVQLDAEGELSVAESGLKALEPYKVRKAIIFAAGFGSRMAPVTLDTPKPLVKVNGKRIVETLLDALVAKGITNIVIVRGYKKECFDVLLEKYPFIKFIDNDSFNVTNNISSAIRALDFIDRCYICEADLIIRNSNLIRKYEFSSNYLGARVNETDDWCFTVSGKFISKYAMGGDDCYQAFGISYWDEDSCKKLREDLVKIYNGRAGKENFWEMVPLKLCRKDFKVEVRKCEKTDIVEIDNFSELVDLDPSYANYPGHEKY